MELGSPVILISAFGRGHWLAAALAKEGIKTTLIDVSAKLGVWPTEDVEGPFGFFRNEKINELQLKRLYSESSYKELPNGFTLWLKDGPFECKGPLTQFKLDKFTLSKEVRNILLEGTDGKNGRSIYKNIISYDFSEGWFLHLLHQYAATTYTASALGATVGKAISAFSSFSVRQTTQKDFEKSFEWLKEQGVEVIKSQQIQDASFGNKKTVTGLELSGKNQGLYRLEQLVWMLSSEETYFLNERFGKYFFPNGAEESEWCWLRYRMGLQQCFERDRLPEHCVVIDDLYSPWTHENMMVLQRTTLPEQFDLWIRVPTVQRFNKDYLTGRGFGIKKHLLSRMALSNPEVLSFPQEYYYPYNQLGPARFPVFNENKKGRVKSIYKNLFLDGPEIWPHYSHDVYFEHQELIFQKLLNWWKEKLLRQQKEKRKEQFRD